MEKNFGHFAWTYMCDYLSGQIQPFNQARDDTFVSYVYCNYVERNVPMLVKGTTNYTAKNSNPRPN